MYLPMYVHIFFHQIISHMYLPMYVHIFFHQIYSQSFSSELSIRGQGHSKVTVYCGYFAAVGLGFYMIRLVVYQHSYHTELIIMCGWILLFFQPGTDNSKLLSVLLRNFTFLPPWILKLRPTHQRLQESCILSSLVYLRHLSFILSLSYGMIVLFTGLLPRKMIMYLIQLYFQITQPSNSTFTSLSIQTDRCMCLLYIRDQ